MKKTRFFPVYDKTGKAPKVREYYKKSGVYLIKEQGRLVYIGFSRSNVYKTLMRHFQSWSDPTQERITYQGRPRDWYTARIVSATPAQAEKLERALIIKHQPRDNGIKYDTYVNDNTDIALIRTYEEAPF